VVGVDDPLLLICRLFQCWIRDDSGENEDDEKLLRIGRIW
jgi:hypothetical protein